LKPLARLAELATDGGRRDCGKAAASFSLRCDSKLYKIVCLLPETSVDRAELAALVLGLKTAELLGVTELDWTSDSQVTVSSATTKLDQWQSKDWQTPKGKPVANSDLWLLIYGSRLELKGRQDSNSAEVLKCHKACDWIIDKGEQFMSDNTQGFLLKNSHQEKNHSWFLIDGRELFKKPDESGIRNILTRALEEFEN